MLPAVYRLRRRQDFTATVRGGRRAGGRSLVIHLLIDPVRSSESEVESVAPVRVGFVVAKSVGIAVVRKRVTRQLRHVVRDRLEQLPPGATMVVRALPAAAETGYAELGAQFDQALRRCLTPRGQAHVHDVGSRKGER